MTRAVKNKCPLICGPRSLPDRLTRLVRSGDLMGPVLPGLRSNKKVKDGDNRQMQEKNSKQHDETEIKRCYGGEENEEKTDPQKEDETMNPQTMHDAEHTKPCQILLKMNTDNQTKDEKYHKSEKYPKKDVKVKEDFKKHVPGIDNRFNKSFEGENRRKSLSDKRSPDLKSDVQNEQKRVGKVSRQTNEIPGKTIATHGSPYLKNVLDGPSDHSNSNLKGEFASESHGESVVGYGISELNFLDHSTALNQNWNIGGQGKNLEKHFSNMFSSLKNQMDGQEGIDEITVENTLRSLMGNLHLKLSRQQFGKVMEAIGMKQGTKGFLECFNLLSNGGDLDFCDVVENDGALNQQQAKVNLGKNETSEVHQMNWKEANFCPEDARKQKYEENEKYANSLEKTDTSFSSNENEHFEEEESGLDRSQERSQVDDVTDPEYFEEEVDKSLDEPMEKMMGDESDHDTGVGSSSQSDKKMDFDAQVESAESLVDRQQVDEIGLGLETDREADFQVSGLGIPGQPDDSLHKLDDGKVFIQGLAGQPKSVVAKATAEDLKQKPFCEDHDGPGEIKSFDFFRKKSRKVSCLRRKRKSKVVPLNRGQVWKGKDRKRKLALQETSLSKNSSMFGKDSGYTVEVLSGKVNVRMSRFRTKSCMSSAGNKGGNSSIGGKGGNSPSGGKGGNSRRNSKDNDDTGSEEDGRSNGDDRNNGDGDGSLPVSNLPTAALVNCNIPGQDFKSVRKKHSNITDDNLMYVLGSMSLDTGPDIQEDPGLLGEVDHCLRILLHSLPNHSDPDCSVCNLIHSLFNHFASCTQVYKQCQVCWQTLQLALHHVHRCIQEGRRSKESQTDVCFQLTKAADGQADVVKEKSERLWSKMKKCVVKVFQPVGLHGSGSLGMYSLVENEEANFSGLTTSSMASSDQSGLSSMGSGTSQITRSPAQSIAASSNSGQFQRVGSGRFQPSLRSIPESPQRNASLRRLRKISNESIRSQIGSKSDDTSLPESQKADAVEASTGELSCLSLPNSTAEPSSGPLDDISVTTSLSSTSGQNEEGQTAIDVIYDRYKPMIEGNGNIFPENRSTPVYQDPYETQKTYGMDGVISLPIRPNIQREREQLLSLELRPTGEPGIGEVVYGTRRQIMKVARYWARIRGNLDNESYKHQIREEGVILDSAKRNLCILLTRYQKKRQWMRLVHLGNGVAGKCHLAKDERSGFKFCVKRVHIAKYEENELVTWSDLDHSNIVKLYGAIRHGNKIYIFCEFIAGGSLTTLINEQRSLNRRLSHWMCIRYFKQLLQVLTYLKSKNILHEDLKADNILIRQSSTLIAVADFGLARSMNVDSEMKGMSPTGSQTQWSPEKATSMGHGFAADVWAAVCILVHMLSGHPPWTQRYPGLQMLHFVIFTQSPPLADIPANIQEVMRDLITQAFTVDPTLRPSAAELLEHEAFKILDQGSPDTYYSTLVNSGQVIPNNQIDDSVNGPQELDSILNSLDTRRPTLEGAGQQAAGHPSEESLQGEPETVYTRNFVSEAEANCVGLMRTDDRSHAENENNSASGFTKQGSGTKLETVSPGTSEEDSRSSIGSRIFGSGHGSNSSSLRKLDSLARTGDQSSASSNNKSPGTDTREEGQLFGLEHNPRIISDEGSSSAGPVVLSLGSLPLPPDGSGAVGYRGSDNDGNQPNWSHLLQASMAESSEGHESSFEDPDDHISQYLRDDQSIAQYVRSPATRLLEYCPHRKDSIRKLSNNLPKFSSLVDITTFSGITLDPTDSYQENMNHEQKRNTDGHAEHFDVPDCAGSGGIVQFAQSDNTKRPALQPSSFKNEAGGITTIQKNSLTNMIASQNSQGHMSRQTSRPQEKEEHTGDTSTISPIPSGQSSPFHQRSHHRKLSGGLTPGSQGQDQSPFSGVNSPREVFSGQNSDEASIQRRPHNSGNSSRESSIGQASGQASDPRRPHNSGYSSKESSINEASGQASDQGRLHESGKSSRDSSFGQASEERRPHNSGNSSRESSVGQASSHSSPIPSRSQSSGQGYVSPSQHSPLRTEYIDLPISRQPTPLGHHNEDPFPTSFYPPSNLFEYEHVSSDELFGDRSDPKSFSNFGKNGPSSSTPLQHGSPVRSNPVMFTNPGQFHKDPLQTSRIDVHIKPEPSVEAGIFQRLAQKTDAKLVQNPGFQFQSKIYNSLTPEASPAKQKSVSTNGSMLKGGTADYAFEPKVKDSGSLDNMVTEQEVEKSPKKNKNLTLDVNRTVQKSSIFQRVASEPANVDQPAIAMSHPKTCPEISTRDSSGIGTSIQYTETRNSLGRNSEPSVSATPDRSRHISSETSPSTPKSQYEQQEKEFSALSQSDVDSCHGEILAFQETAEEDQDVHFTVGPGSFKEDLESVQKMIPESHIDLGHKYELLRWDSTPLLSILVLPRYEEWRDIVDSIRTVVKTGGIEHFTLKTADGQLVDYNSQLTHDNLQFKVCPVSEDDVRTGESICWCLQHDFHFI